MRKTYKVALQLLFNGEEKPGTHTCCTHSLNTLYSWFRETVPEGWEYRLSMSGEALKAFGGYRSVDGTGYIPLKHKLVGRLRVMHLLD